MEYEMTNQDTVMGVSGLRFNVSIVVDAVFEIGG